MFNIEDTEWKLNVAQSILELEARQRVVLNILIEEGIMTAPQFNGKLEQMKEQKYFKDSLEIIQNTREELKDSFDFMKMIRDLNNKKEKNEKD